MSTTVATATTTTATVTSAGGTTSSTPTSSTATTSATSTPVSSTATSSTPTATLGTGAAAPGTPFATPFGPGGAPFVTPLPSCLMPESFTGSGDFEDYLQQFNTAALLSGWFSPTHDNRPHYFALRLRGNALHFYTTLSAAQQTDFNLLVDAFRQNYTTNVDILKARLKAARQQPNQDISAFLCDIRTLARRAYRAFPHLVEQIVLTSFIEGLSDATLRWELRVQTSYSWWCSSPGHGIEFFPGNWERSPTNKQNGRDQRKRDLPWNSWATHQRVDGRACSHANGRNQELHA